MSHVLRHRLHRSVAVAGALVLVVGVGVASASVGTEQVISGPSPFTACSNQGLTTNYLNAEVEPSLTVSPANSNQVVAGWQQDRWGDPNEGGAHGLLSWASSDGGIHGATSQAAFDSCQGGSGRAGAFDRASDVWLSTGPDGTVYESALVFDELSGRNAVTVATSRDGGRTWGAPVVVDRMDSASFSHGDDKESVTADPNRPGWAYVVWDEYSSLYPNYSAGPGQNSNRGPAYFSETSDYGAHWSTPRPIVTRDNGTLANQIVVRPDGTLLDFFTNFVVTNVRGTVQWSAQLDEVRSSDQGQTWSAPIIVTPMDYQGTFTPSTSQYVRAGDGLFSVAQDPASGALYLAWEDNRFVGVDQVALSASHDGGWTWSAPSSAALTVASANPWLEQAFTPTIAVGASGTVALTFYDFRNSASGGSLVDYWAQTSSDGGSTWSGPQRLTATSFDALGAPSAGGLMIGDYEGLAAVGSAFLSAFEVTNATAGNPTDIVLARFTP